MIGMAILNRFSAILLRPDPDPPTLAFMEKARGFPQKARVFLFAEPLKSLEKEGKRTKKKARKIGKQKKARKS